MLNSGSLILVLMGFCLCTPCLGGVEILSPSITPNAQMSTTDCRYLPTSDKGGKRLSCKTSGLQHQTNYMNALSTAAAAGSHKQSVRS